MAGELRVEFTSTEKPSWRHSGMETGEMVQEIANFCARFEQLGDEEMCWVREQYEEKALGEFLFQVNKIEKEGFDTYPETEAAISNGALCTGDVSKLEDPRLVSLCSLHLALRHWFPTECHQPEAPELSIQELEKCHKLLLGSTTQRGISGLIRRREEDVVFTKTEDGVHLFVWPTEVKQRLHKLFTRTNSALQRLEHSKRDQETISDLLKVGGAFFLEFESIHPFFDGNGRCGRVLLAYILRRLMPFPNVLLVDRESDYGLPPFVAPVYYYDCFQDVQSQQSFEMGKDGKPIFTKEAAEQCKLGFPEDLTALITEGVYVAWKRFFSVLDSWRQDQPPKSNPIL